MNMNEIDVEEEQRFETNSTEDIKTIELNKAPKKFILYTLLSALSPILLTRPSSSSRNSLPEFTTLPFPTDVETSIPFIIMGLIITFFLGGIIYHKLKTKYALSLSIDKQIKELSIQFISFSKHMVYQVIPFEEIETINLYSDFEKGRRGSNWSYLTLCILLKNGTIIETELSSWESFLSVYKELKDQINIELEQDYDVTRANLQSIVSEYETNGTLPSEFSPFTKIYSTFLIIPLIVWILYTLIANVILPTF